MSSKSSVIATFVYAGLSAVLVSAFAYGKLQPLIKSLNLSVKGDVSDFVVVIALLALGVLAVSVGADILTTTIVGTLGAFVTFTLFQPEPIRYMTFAALLFCMGMYGMVSSRNAIRVLMSIELMLNAVNINLVTMSHYIDPSFLRGQVFAVFILTVAAAEAAVGLAIVLQIYRNNATVDMDKFNLLKW